MRRFTAILLLFTLAFPFTMRIGIVGHYLMNKTYYATVLCENRGNTDMSCEGSCQLKEELNEVNRPVTSHSRNPVREQLKISVFIIHDCFNLVSPPLNCTLLHDLETNNATSKSISDFFHPPEPIV